MCAVGGVLWEAPSYAGQLIELAFFSDRGLRTATRVTKEKRRERRKDARGKEGKDHLSVCLKTHFQLAEGAAILE